MLPSPALRRDSKYNTSTEHSHGPQACLASHLPSDKQPDTEVNPTDRSCRQAKDAAAETVGVGASKASGSASQMAGEAKGKAAELKGEAKGKAEEVKGKI